MMAQVLCLLWSCLFNEHICVTYDYSFIPLYSLIIQIAEPNIRAAKAIFLEKVMRSQLQREEIEFIMGLFNCNEAAEEPAPTKKQPVRADTKKVVPTPCKANCKTSYINQLN